ncbi:MAG: hypothetical protein ACTS2F_26400 [Thainema sp.]
MNEPSTRLLRDAVIAIALLVAALSVEHLANAVNAPDQVPAQPTQSAPQPEPMTSS